MIMESVCFAGIGHALGTVAECVRITIQKRILVVARCDKMANDYVERLQSVLDALIGCSTTDGQIIDIDGFNEALEELAYIVNKMDFEVW